MKNKPPIKLNLKVKPSNINNIPKYIGFLEYLKTPLITKEDAFSIDIGLTVVFCLLNELTAVANTAIPNRKEIVLNEFRIEKLNSGKYGLDE